MCVQYSEMKQYRANNGWFFLRFSKRVLFAFNFRLFSYQSVVWCKRLGQRIEGIKDGQQHTQYTRIRGVCISCRFCPIPYTDTQRACADINNNAIESKHITRAVDISINTYRRYYVYGRISSFRYLRIYLLHPL